MAINILEAFENKPPLMECLWPKFLLGTVGALVAPGATGKSFWSLQAAMAVACDVPGGDLLGLKPEVNGRVHYIAGEDPEIAIMQRIHALGTHLDAEARQSIAKNLSIESVVGQQQDLMNIGERSALIEKCHGMKLIVIDTLSRVHRLDENSNGEMGSLITSLEHIAIKTGACVLYLHHVSKTAIRDGSTDQQSASRGASALTNQPRWCSFMARMSADESGRLSENPGGAPIGSSMDLYVKHGSNKENYAKKDPVQWYRRSDGGVLLPVTLYSRAEKASSTKPGKMERAYV
jgi:RecA-family ATPase